jgi:hypothetical protein
MNDYDYYEECHFDAVETLHNTVDRTFYKRHYRLWLSRYGGKTVSCPICPAHGGENYNGGYKNKRSWKKWRKYQCKYMVSRESVYDVFAEIFLEEDLQV